jgi:hypothetical protein
MPWALVSRDVWTVICGKRVERTIEVDGVGCAVTTSID